MASEPWQCGRCKQWFPTVEDPDWTEADKQAEMKSHFGNVPAEQIVRVCDSCYKVIDPAHHPHIVETACKEMWLSEIGDEDYSDMPELTDEETKALNALGKDYIQRLIEKVNGEKKAD